MTKSPEKDFENLVRRITKRVLLSEAYNRQKFIETIQNMLVGAFGEWSKYKTANINNLTVGWDDEGRKLDLQEKWRKEYLRLLHYNFTLKLIKKTKGCKNKEKALKVAIEEANAEFLHELKYAVPYVQECFRKVHLKKEVSWESSKEFFDIVWEIFDQTCKKK